MLINPEQAIANILSQKKSDLQPLLKQAQTLDHLNSLLGRILTEPLRSACRVLSYEQGCLTVASESGHWTHHLRYATPELLSQLRQQPRFAGIIQIKVKVQPLVKMNTPEPTPLSLAVPPSSAVGANSLLATAAVTEDKQLKQALESLAQQLQPADL